MARQVEIAVVTLGTADQVEGWVVALEDLTQLLRAQRQAAWSEVARRIAHQIKNPLTPIRLAAERIARQSERRSPELPAVVQQGCTAIVEHVQAMQEMVDAFARYAKFPPLSRRPVQVGELGQQRGRAVRGGAARRQGALLRRLRGAARCCSTRSSSGRCSPTSSTTPSRPRRAGDGRRSRSRWEGDEVVFSVTDEGPGLPGDDPEVLFQPFYSTKGRGSGVGLALVQRIVTDHGGTVRLENGPAAGRGGDGPHPGGAAMSHGSILVVDDEAGIRQQLAAILGDEGYAVSTVGSGEEALAALARELYDLVLLDVWLPGADGIETLRQVRASGSRRRRWS